MKIFKVLTLLLVFTISLVANDVRIFLLDESGKLTPEMVEKKFADAGFTTGNNRDMNRPYTIQFKETSFDVYNLFNFYDKNAVNDLIKKYPDVGIFSPMSSSIWKGKGDKKLYMAFLTSKAIQNILNIKEKTFDEIESKVENVLKSIKGSKEITVSYKSKTSKDELITKYTLDSSKDGWSDIREEFEMSFEGELKPKGFTMADFTVIVDAEDNEGSDYFFYDSYSICKLKVIYQVSKVKPEAGAFAPCSMAVYQKKDSEEIVIEFPSVYNWINSLDIKDEKAIEELHEAQKGMETILKSLTE